MMIRFQRFQSGVAFRIGLLVLAIFAFSYLLLETDFLVARVITGGVIVYQVYNLFHLVDRVNRDVNRFFDSIQHDDFSQTYYIDNSGDSFNQLKQAFNRVTQRFLQLRSEKEEHFLHLQTVVKHVGVGLLSFSESGEVELMNAAAKQLLDIDAMKNIENVEQLGAGVTEVLRSLKAGSSASLKLEVGGVPRYLSFGAAQFKLQEIPYTLISIKDIQTEIDREHLVKELEIAGAVQKSLLPSTVPEVPGFDLAGMCRPAKEVGGDYYDFIPVGEDKLVLIIGDVSGKGTSASFYMTLTKGYIQSLMQEDISPVQVLAKVNDLMLKTVSKKIFVTLLAAVLDLRSGEVVCARAGHNPGIHLCGDDGAVRWVKPAGPALGLAKSIESTGTDREYKLQLAENDWLVLYTDGISEAMDGNRREFGAVRMIETIRGNVRNSAQQMVDAIIAEVDAFAAGAPQHDDMTLIALRRCGSSGPFHSGTTS